MKSPQLLEKFLSLRWECLQEFDELIKREHGCAGCPWITKSSWRPWLLASRPEASIPEKPIEVWDALLYPSGKVKQSYKKDKGSLCRKWGFSGDASGAVSTLSESSGTSKSSSPSAAGGFCPFRNWFTDMRLASCVIKPWKKKLKCKEDLPVTQILIKWLELHQVNHVKEKTESDQSDQIQPSSSPCDNTQAEFSPVCFPYSLGSWLSS